MLLYSDYFYGNKGVLRIRVSRMLVTVSRVVLRTKGDVGTTFLLGLIHEAGLVLINVVRRVAVTIWYAND